MSDDKKQPGHGEEFAERPYPSDCQITEALLEKAASRSREEERGYVWRACLPKAKNIQILLLDVDGVLTDGSLIYTADGKEMKIFHSRDGFGMNMLRRAGVELGIVTARTSEALRRRAADLAVSHLYEGVKNKLEIYRQLLGKTGLTPEETAFMGDDWLDLPLLKRVGFSATVADAAMEVRRIADYVTLRPGGKGAVREVCDLIIEAKGFREAFLKEYLS